MAAALATDILPPQALSRGLPWVGVVGSGAGILSFAAAGLIIDYLGATVLFTGGVVIAVAAVLQFYWLSRPGGQAVDLTGGPATVIGPLAGAARSHLAQQVVYS